MCTMISTCNQITLMNNYYTFIFKKKDGIPFDGVPQNFVENIHTGVTVVFCLLSTAGIVFAIACMCYNFIYRDRK